jgi:F0F1-type ATP synthase membrane subunit c/vacuolar-type H+-ATPase subunit K
MNRRNVVSIAACALLLAALAVGLGGCAGTGLVNMWADSEIRAPLRNVYVIAVKPDEGSRRIMEDAFVSELGKYGVTATPSYRNYPAALPDSNTVREHVRAAGYDGVVVAARLETVMRTNEVAPYTTTEARTAYSSWTGRYHTYYVDVVHEGETETTTIVPHRVDVWAADGVGGHLVWTGEGRSIDPNSSSQVSKEIIDRILPELAKARIVPPKN